MIECHSSAYKSPWHDYVIHELKRKEIRANIHVTINITLEKCVEAKGAKLSGWPRLSFLDLAKKLMCAFVKPGFIS